MRSKGGRSPRLASLYLGVTPDIYIFSIALVLLRKCPRYQSFSGPDRTTLNLSLSSAGVRQDLPPGREL